MVVALVLGLPMGQGDGRHAWWSSILATSGVDGHGDPASSCGGAWYERREGDGVVYEGIAAGRGVGDCTGQQPQLVGPSFFFVLAS
jgi:hypothetical protein